MSEDVAERRIGTTLQGKWTLEKLLGSGGMASVYLGRHKIGRLDAIKILHNHIASSDILRARFEQEARVVNSFQHKGAVEIRDIDISEDGAPFLVMELLEGESLSELVRRTGPLAPERMLRIADETLDVLAAAHARGIIHRDIKPDNLFILKDGSVKVLDFGIARLLEGTGEKKKYKTKTGTTLGTATYMAPEQARGIAEIDGRADLYAVGATMFRVITNRRVHEADSQVELLMKLVSEPAPKLASVAPNIPAPICAVIDRALAFERNERYPDAKSMQADVRAVLQGAPIAPVVDAAPPTVVPVVRAEPRPEPKIEPPKIEPPKIAPPKIEPKVEPPRVAAQPTRVLPQMAPAPRMDPPTAATVMAAPAPADIRASVPSVRQPAAYVAPVQPQPQPQPRGGLEIFGIRLSPLVIGAAAIVLVLILAGMVFAAIAFFAVLKPASPPADTPTSEPTATSPPVTTAAPPVTSSPPAVGTPIATTPSTATTPPGHGKPPPKHGK